MGLVRAIKNVQSGAVVVEAAQPGQALKLFKAGKFDAVFLDMVLDDAGDGMQLMEQFLKQDPDTIVILTTGLERNSSEVTKAISQGAFAHIVKPVRVQEVSRVLAEVEEELQ